MRRVGLGFEGGFSLRRIPRFAHVAEEYGFDSVWFDEGLGGDAFSLATACIPATSSIGLGTSVTSVFTRSPTIISMASATINTLSSGRFRLGLGSSHRVQVEGEHGLAYDKPLSKVVETVEIVRKAASGRVSYAGSIFSVKAFEFLFEQHPNPIPIYLGAVFPTMLRKAGEIRDGIILTTCNVEQIKRSIGWVREGTEKANRDWSRVDVANFTPCCVSDDTQKARHVMRRYVASTVSYFPRYGRLAAEAGFKTDVDRVRNCLVSRGREQSLQPSPRRLTGFNDDHRTN